MSIPTIYSDIDFSFEPNIYNDIPSLINENDIKNTLYNNLMITSAERPYDDSLRMDIRDLIHDVDDFISRKQFKDAIIEASELDPRIENITDVRFNDTTDYSCVIGVDLVLNMNESNGKEVSLNLIIEKN